MKCLCDCRCKYWKEIDMFGKEPELYYKGRPKKTSWMGRILSILFVVIYFAFLLYKVIRMMQKKDVTFYDRFTYVKEPSKVKITNENFYGGFALEDPVTYDTFIDERIYIPKAYFKRAEKKGDNFIWDVVELELEQCKLEKFGKIYQEKFMSKNLNNLYCIKNLDFFLEGHFSYDLYSFLYFEFFPCVNTSEKQDCKPIEDIDYYLKNTFVQFQWQDIELNSENYTHPINPRSVDVYTTVGKKLFKEIHAFFQVIQIETDLDFIGFDEFDYMRKDVYLKYDEMVIMSNLIEKDIYETGEHFCDFTIKLSENVRIHRRTYTNLITILGDVGGLMEVVFTLFRLVTSFSLDILYEISLVNNLFNFNLDKKVVILKDKKLKLSASTKDISQNENISKKKIRVLPTQNLNYNTEEDNNQSTKRLKGKNGIILNDNNENLPISKFEKRKQNRRKTHILQLNKDLKNIFPLKRGNITNKNVKIRFNLNENNISQETKREEERIIDKIRMTRCWVYCCFCCARRRKILQNILLDEGMNIISEKLDIFNIFEQLYKNEYNPEKEKTKKTDIIEMSDSCIFKLNSYYKKIHESEQ